MIRLATVIETFEADFLAQYRERVRPEHYRALAAMKHCRTQASLKMQAKCTECAHQKLVPHSCGHRHCPHCQHHESQQWLERQMQKQLPAEYFLMTFTLPAEFRPLAWAQPSVVYDLLLRCSWETVQTFSQNDQQLQGTPGAIAVLHTNTRRLDYHPHVHLVMPAAALDAQRKQWRTKRRKAKASYLFNHKALAKVFRAKLLAALAAAGLALPERYPKAWVVDCKAVGSGESALIYLGRYLYRGRHPGEGYRRLPQRPGELPLSRRQDREDGAAHRFRRAFYVAGSAACVAQRLPARAQFRLSASQLQAPDRLAARAAEVRSWPGTDMGQATRTHSLPVLRGSDDHRENAAALAVLGAPADPTCRPGSALTM